MAGQPLLLRWSGDCASPDGHSRLPVLHQHVRLAGVWYPPYLWSLCKQQRRKLHRKLASNGIQAQKKKRSGPAAGNRAHLSLLSFQECSRPVNRISNILQLAERLPNWDCLHASGAAEIPVQTISASLYCTDCQGQQQGFTQHCASGCRLQESRLVQLNFCTALCWAPSTAFLCPCCVQNAIIPFDL